MSASAYLASEDSELLRRALKKYDGAACLEIGSGNGGGLIDLSGRFALAVGTDVVKPSNRSWRQSGSDYILADAASCFRSGSFDLVAFNPPYVPSEDRADVAVDGGAGGEEVAIRFLLEAVRVLKRGGRIVMLLSSDNPVEPIKEVCESQGLAMKAVDSKHLFYETLSVYELFR